MSVRREGDHGTQGNTRDLLRLSSSPACPGESPLL